MMNLNLFIELHPEDQKKKFLDLSLNEQIELINKLDSNISAEFFEHLDDTIIVNLFNNVKEDKMISIINEMDDDEVVKIFRIFNDTEKNFYLNLVNSEKAEVITHLLSYNSDEAGSLMEKKFLYLRSYKTVKQARTILFKEGANVGNINYIYVLDKEKHLLGVVSLKELILANDENATIVDIMTSNIISANDRKDKQIAAHLVKDYDFYAIPVVNDDNQMQGIITEDDVIDVLLEDAKDNIEHIAGVNDVEIKDSLIKNIFSRLPWLLILLTFTLINSRLYLNFDNVLTISYISAILPLVASVSGNVGIQTLGITVYRISSEHDMSFTSIIKYIMSEMKIYFFVSLCLNAIFFSIFYFILHYNDLAFIIAITFTLTFITSSLFGALIPIILDKLKINTAIASGPLISTVNDLISIVIYLSIATIIIQ